jgi:hypothetical protein
MPRRRRYFLEEMGGHRPAPAPMTRAPNNISTLVMHVSGWDLFAPRVSCPHGQAEGDAGAALQTDARDE